MHTLVERMIPSEVLLQQGIYLQTCAHIELSLWQIVRIADGHKLGAVPEFEAYLKVKKVTPKLIAAAKKATGLVPAPLGLRLAALVARVHAGVANRNLAAHGAWFAQPKSDRLHVEHYFMAPTPSGDRWHYINRTFSRRQIDLAIEDCNLILEEAVDIRRALETLLELKTNLPMWPKTMETSGTAMIAGLS